MLRTRASKLTILAPPREIPQTKGMIEMSKAWITCETSSQNAAKLLTQVAHKMIEPGLILSVRGINIGGGRMSVEVHKIQAVTHVGMSSHPIYSEITEERVREILAE